MRATHFNDDDRQDSQGRTGKNANGINTARRRLDFTRSSKTADDESEYESLDESSGDGSDACNDGAYENGNQDTVDGQEFKLDPNFIGISSEELEDDDVELWLMRMPRHSTLDNFQPIELPSTETNGSKQERLCGSCKGSYSYRDHGAILDKNVRAAFVVQTQDGGNGGEILVSKPFSKMISVTYDVELANLGDAEPPKRKYPEKPLNLSQKYFPVGGGGRKRKPEPERVVAAKMEPNENVPSTNTKQTTLAKRQKTGKETRRGSSTPKRSRDTNVLER